MTTNDPRKSQGSIIGPGGPHDRHAVIIDARNAVLLEHITTTMVEPSRNGNPQTPVVALSMVGRINQTTERSEVVYLFDAEATANICADLIGLMHRAGVREFPDYLEAAMRRLP